MPHTNITQEVQKVYTKKSPHEAVFVEPGETIDDHAVRVLQVAAEDAAGEAPAGTAEDDDDDTE